MWEAGTGGLLGTGGHGLMGLMGKSGALIALGFMVLATWLQAGPIKEVADELGLAELIATFDAAKVERVLGESGHVIELGEDRAAAAALVAMGVLPDWQLGDSAVVQRVLAEWGAPQREKVTDLELPLERVAGILRVASIGGYELLRSDEALVAALDEAVGAKVLTGYGLRPLNVSAATDAKRTVIYSHSSLSHVKQLVGLVASEGFKGRVFVAPKVSAFIFRDGWGERPEWLNELGPGIYVAQGPEMLVHFEFESVADRQRFDALVERYAKKDDEAETGNLIRSWWQPFYYTETAAAGYAEITRITLRGAEVEASLLMLPDRAAVVREHFADAVWPLESDSIWVSPPFHRFLEGDFK